MKKMIDLKIEGMMCEHCAKHATEALKSLAQVKKVTIDLKNGLAHVLVTDDVNVSDFENVISEAGYTFKGII